MLIKNRFSDGSLSCPKTFLQIDVSTGNKRNVQEDLLSEHILDVYIHSVHTMRLTCTAEQLPELVLGRLLSEGIVFEAEDVESILICETGNTADVLLSENYDKKAGTRKEEEDYIGTTPSCCTGNRILNGRFVIRKHPDSICCLNWKTEWLGNIYEHFSKDTDLHKTTHATHSAGLFFEGKLVAGAEDMGRHNAIDKVIGQALISNIDLSQCMLFTTGRLPVDMVQKVLYAGIPVVVTKEMVTLEGVALAEQYGLTVIGKLRADSCVVFCEPMINNLGKNSYSNHRENP